MFEKEITFDRFIRGLMVVAGLGLSIYVLNLLSTVLLPFFYSLVPGIYDLSYGEVLPIQTSSPQPNLVYRHYLITNIGSHSRLFWLIIPPAIAEFVRFRDLIATSSKKQEIPP